MSPNIYTSYKLVTIGISDFTAPHYHLPNARSDAQAFTHMLQDNFGFTCIAQLLDHHATRAAIIDLFDNVLPKTTDKNDALIIFVATHGHPCEDRMGNDDGFFVPHDGDKDNPASNILVSRIRDSYLPYIPAKHVLWIADFCYSGLGMRDLTEAPTLQDPNEAVLHDLTRKPIRQMLSAGARDQRVLDGGRHGRSIFLDRIMEVLDDSGEFFTVEKAAVKIRELVAGDAKRLGHTQTPQFGVLHGHDATFVFHSRKQKTAAPIHETPSPPIPDAPTPQSPLPANAPLQNETPLPLQVLHTRDREITRLKSAISALLLRPDWPQPAQCATLIEHCAAFLSLIHADAPDTADNLWIEEQLATLWNRAPWCLLTAHDCFDHFDPVPALLPQAPDLYSVDFHPAGAHLCTASESPDLQIFNLHSQTLTSLPTGHTAFIRCARYSPDGSMILTAGADAAARVLVHETRQILRIFPHPARALCAAWAPDAHSLVVGGDDGALLLWSLTDFGKPRKLTGHQGRIFACTFSPDGRTIASAGEDQTARFWSADTGEPLSNPFAHPDVVCDLALAADGRALTACADGLIRLIRCPKFTPIHQLHGHTDIVWSIRLLPGEKYALSASADGQVILWDLTSGRATQKFTPPPVPSAPQNPPAASMHLALSDLQPPRWIRSVAITPDARTFACVGHHHLAALWRLRPRAPGVTRRQILSGITL